MVLDYSDKVRGVREGGLERKPERERPPERKPVQKNRPRKEPAGLFALLSVVVLALTFGVGVFTGWLMFKGSKKAPAPVAAQLVKKEEPAQAPQQPQPPGLPDAQLTFYKTLPAGGKGAIGSGLNPKKQQNAAAPHAATADPQAPAAEPSADGKPEAPVGHYTVQLASYRDRKEAEAAQGKLSAKGVAAVVVESKLPDRGVWYRIRVGHGLGRKEAEELAAKSGKGAIVLPE
jgi:cell division septation protein DedD